MEETRVIGLHSYTHYSKVKKENGTERKAPDTWTMGEKVLGKK